jgi:vitamin B12 transporter
MTNCKVSRQRDKGESRERINGRRGIFLPLVLLACSLFLLSDLAAAQQADDTAVEVAAADSANQDLLLFWEEKELYVQTATRTAKPISQVAENMEVVTAKDILDMNARNVAEVLRRVPGLFVELNTSDFGTASSLRIQGSYERHVTVLVDGVAWNFLSGGNAEVGSIPVQIIDRIEIVKGAASSTWGSALGGVINIITKGAGDSSRPKGMLSASYGEKNSQDYNAEVYGKGGPIAYYLYAGRQDSDGLLNDRDYQRSSFYAKLTATPAHNLDLLFTIGYGDPDFNNGNAIKRGRLLNPRTSLDTLMLTGTLDYRISPELAFKAGAYSFDQKLDTSTSQLPNRNVLQRFVFDEQTVGGNLKLVYTSGMHTAVLGSDISYGSLDQTSTITPNSFVTNPAMNKWAIFANDTIVLQKLAITPGVRFDHNNVSGSFVSPSLGLTYELGEHAIARASAARGFTTPPLSSVTGGGVGALPNPKLTAEEGWSYQVGLESAAMDYLNLKANFFRHDVKNEIPNDVDPVTQTFINHGSIVRQGYELQAESAPVFNVSLKAAHAFVHIDADSQPAPTVNYSYLIGIKYDDRKSIVAQLFGTYVWWNLPAANGAKYDNFIWDLNLSKKFAVCQASTIDVFANVHNLFNASQYTLSVYPNPGRWVEGGLRFNF